MEFNFILFFDRIEATFSFVFTEISFKNLILKYSNYTWKIIEIIEWPEIK